MGIAAGLFYSSSKNTLDWRIRPSDEQYEQQQERWNDLAAYLIEDLKERSGYPINSWLQGSYKFGTQVRPAAKGQEFDIDLGIYFRWEGEPEDGDHDPIELKGFVRSSLLEYAEDDENEAKQVADSKARCERLHFQADFHIDVPCYHLNQSSDARHLATEEDKWEDSDPKAIYRWWKDSFEDRDLPRLRRLVRYLKMWAALKFAEGDGPSSILLTVLVGEEWEALDHDLLSGDDEYLVAVVQAVIARLTRSAVVPNPADTSEDLNRLDKAKSDAFIDKLRGLLSAGERALEAQTRTLAAEIWGEAFAQFFPLPDDEDEEVAVLKEAGGALVPVLFNPQVAIQARPNRPGARIYQGINEIGPIPKDCEITFKLMNEHELPLGATLRWTARNQGDEAEDVNDLGHEWGDERQVIEHSAYRGTHFMDVSVRLGDRIIGRRRMPVRITGLALPLRNPPRPNWTKLRGRR